MLVGDQEILLPTTMVGNYPNPRWYWDKPFVAGVIDVKSTITETADEVADRIRQCLEYVPAERLGLTTDCGLVMLQRMTAQSKLRALADGAAIVRAELAEKGN